jgi:hypothetical protein
MNKQLAALVLVAAAVAGCGSTTSTGTVASGSGNTPAKPPTLSGSPDPMKPPTGPTGTPRVLPTTPATVVSHTQKRVSLPWRFLKLTDGGRKVEIALQYGGCSSFSYVQVAQQSGAVQLTVWGSGASGKAICPAFEAIVTGTVTLTAPLGSRQLLHGPVSPGDLPQ